MSSSDDADNCGRGLMGQWVCCNERHGVTSMQEICGRTYRYPLRQCLFALGVGQSPHQGTIMPQVAQGPHR